MIEEFIRDFTKAAHEKGITDLEFYTESIQKAAMEVYQGKVQDQQCSRTQTCYIRGAYQEKEGTVYVEDFSACEFDREIRIIQENAEAVGKEFIPLQLSNVEATAEYENCDMQKMAEQMICLEQEAQKTYPLLEKVDRIYVNDTWKKIGIRNDSGKRMEDVRRKMSAGCQAQARKGEQVQSAYYEICKEEIKPESLKEPVKKAAENAVQMLNAGPVETGKYPVMLSGSVVSEMLSMYISAFCADQVRRGFSKLSGKIGTQIASDEIMLVEDPQLPDGVNNRQFDDEGVITSKKILISRGKLQGYLYNCAEAEKEKCESTGNGFKENCRAIPTIGVTNLKLTGEEKTLDELKKQMGNGLYIVSCDGMFAGANTVSGDFSVISKGYLIQDGKEAGSVNQITVAGNFFEMLKEIKGISDGYFTMLTEKGAFIGSDIWVEELTVSGV